MPIELDENQDRPCLHCLIVELIDEFYAGHPAATGEPDTIDTDEVINALAKTVAELTSSQDATRQKMIEQLMQEIINYDTEFRQDDVAAGSRSDARH